MTREEILTVAKPILFNTEMTRAIKDNRKTVTRRVIKFPKGQTGRLPESGARDYLYYPGGIKYPPYRPGDILYVRETWAPWSRAEGIMPEIHYKADEETLQGVKWRPSIHMPKEAARIFLRVQDVRVERLQDIDDDEALKEGCGIWGDVDWVAFPAEDFKRVWDTTIKPADRSLYGWDVNPWVWAIEFERVEADNA